MITWLTHAKVRLALHTLRPAADGGDGGGADGAGKPLLLLHPLAMSSPATLPPEVAAWPHAVHALDFTGHGSSTVPAGGGYTAETLMADVDTALVHLGPATLCGAGLGAYVALLIAGARPQLVRGAILRDGPGLAGGSPSPTSTVIRPPDPGATSTPDPFALAELSQDVRPPDYATAYVRQALHLSGLEHPVSVCAVARPDWLAAVVAEPGVVCSDLDAALRRYA
ncbi:MAG: alpha/beta hydrolase [Acidimicrobiia bacterium]|nr:alpha/beta hydrolase [Acidimicrobiia bacterium]